MVDNFNLPAPPGFRGLNQYLPIRVYQRHLPHWRQEGATYFVTFRLADSIPQAHLQSLKRWRERWERDNPEPRSEKQWIELAKEITNRTEVWLDEGYGECIFKEAKASQIMMDAALIADFRRPKSTDIFQGFGANFPRDYEDRVSRFFVKADRI